ncbi:MAG: hypothetical protein ACLFVO_13770 [Chloroflexaceae bacterium]
MHRKQWIMLGLVALATLLVFSLSQATAPSPIWLRVFRPGTN